MDSNEGSTERVRAALRSQSAGAAGGEDDLVALAARALLLLGRGDAAIETEFAAFYPQLLARVAADARRALFLRTRDHARSGLLRGDVLVHFLRLETDRDIVAEAAFDCARIGVAASAGTARGADLVFEFVVTGAIANAGAALGGLLALADEAVNRKLELLRPALALPDADAALAEMACYARAPVHVPTVEFWLAWMATLVVELPAAQRVFDRAAAALLAQRRAIRGDVVFDNSWVAPRPDASEQAYSGARELPLGRYAGTVAARLATLVADASDSAELRRALAAWMLVQ